MKARSILLAAFVSLTLFGCSDSIETSEFVCEGEEIGVYTLHFQTGGTGHLTAKHGDQTVSGDFLYEINGDKVVISAAGDRIPFIYKDGELTPESIFTQCAKG